MSALNEPEETVEHGLIRSQLDEILASEIFRRSERLSRFLRYVVEESLTGQADTLKEQVLGLALYGKERDFDRAADPIVRIDARRLRDKLREYYAHHRHDRVIITLPKGGYAPRFEKNPVAPVSAAHVAVQRPGSARTDISQPTIRYTRYWLSAAMFLAVVIGSLAWWMTERTLSPGSVEIEPLSSYPGSELAPSLSPDGNFVVFAWSGSEGSGPLDLYVKGVKDEALRRLTETPEASESVAAWSPDGREIAFVREGKASGVFTISALGGGERKVADSGSYVQWTPDSHSILVRDREQGHPYGVYQIVLATLEKRLVTRAPVGFGDWKFAVSPEGMTLALVRYKEPGISDLYAVPMQGGEPRRLTEWNAGMNGVAWTPDGREIVYASPELRSRLFRIRSDVSRPAQGTLIADVGAEARDISIAHSGANSSARIAFEAHYADFDLQLLELSNLRGSESLAAEPFLRSTQIESSARFSPNGEWVAFVSYRSGDGEIWLARRDGSELRQLTNRPGNQVVVSAWSPDAQEVAFMATVEGNTDVYAVRISGGPARRLTSDPGIDNFPSWAADGRWVYFSNLREGETPNVWRVPSEGGPAVQSTRNGGFQPQESLDGKFLFYLDTQAPAPGGAGSPSRLMMMPVGGGEEVMVVDGVPYLAWSVIEHGVAFLNREEAFDSIAMYRFATEQVEPLGRLAFRLPSSFGHLTVSRDGRWAFATRQIRNETDLMLIDNYR